MSGNQNPTPRNVTEWPLDPRRILRLIALKSREIAWITLAFTVVGLFFALFWPRTFEAEVVLKLPTPTNSRNEILRPGIDVPYPGASDYMGNFTVIAQSDNVAEKTSASLDLKNHDEFRKLSPQSINRKLFKMVTVARLPASNLFQIKAKAHDPRFAAALADAWAQSFMAENLELSHKSALAQNQFLKEQAEEYYKRIQNPNRLLDAQSKSDDIVYRMIVEEMEQAGLTANVNDAGMVVMTPAEVPEKPVFPKKTLTVLAAFILGLVLAVQWVLLSDRLHPTLRDEVSLASASGVTSLASVPDCREWEKTPSDFTTPPGPAALLSEKKLMGSCYAQSVRHLGAALALRPEGMPHTLGIFSPGRREGRTLACANLALELSRTGRRVLLVDADLRHPAIGKLFNLPEPEGGFTRLLEGSRLSGLMVESGQPNLWLLPNPAPPANPSALFQPGNLEAVLPELIKNFDHVVFDSAPLLDSTEALTLASRLEGVVVLARWDATSSNDLTKTVARLRAAGAPVIGAVLNGIHPGKGLPVWANPRFGRWLWQV